MASGKSAFLTRTFSAAVLIAAAILATMIGGLAFLALVLIFSGLVHREWFRVPVRTRYRGALPLLLACLAASVAHELSGPELGLWIALGGGIVGVAAAIRSGHSVAMAIGGYLYIIVPALVFLHIRQDGVALVIFLFLVVWMTDTGAYVAGRSIGGPKLWPSVSPNKTWSGAVGGMLVGGATAALAASLYGLPANQTGVVTICGLIVSVAAQIGDLAESAWKRHFNVKDSGDIIPGHGGVMDRLDSVVVAAPVLVLVQTAVGVTV